MSPSTWVYELELKAPSGMEYRVAVADSVVHLMYAIDPSDTSRGISPLESASLAGKLSAETSAALGDESSGPRASFLPMPLDGQDSTVDLLRSDIRKAKGGALLVESGDYDIAQGGQNRATWEPKRLGPNPPQSLVALEELMFREVCATVGIGPALAFGMSDGTAMREQRTAFGIACESLAKPVAEELSRKLDTAVSFDFTPMRASDVQGRARGFAAMVGAGMELERAVALSGLLIPDDS